MQKTKIGWTESTWNPVTGCSPVSAGCQHCYAKRMANRLRGRHGYPADDPFRVTLHPRRLDEPLHLRKPRRIFVCSMGDLFHEDVPDEFIDKVFAVMALCPQHTFLILTKRAERMPTYLTDDARRGFGRRSMVGQIHRVARDLCARRRDGTRITIADTPDMRERDWFVPRTLWGDFPVTWMGIPWPLPNVWLGVTAENQETADERIPLLLQTPAAVRYVSIEPLLGPVDLARRTLHPDSLARQSRSSFCDHASCEDWGLCRGQRRDECGNPGRGLDWVIVGGETGPGARPMHPDWVRGIRDQCAAAGVPFFFKNWGAWGFVPGADPVRWGPGQIPLDRDGRDLRGHEGMIASGDVLVARVGRKAAGRLLDGRTHDEMPETGKEKP